MNKTKLIGALFLGLLIGSCASKPVVAVTPVAPATPATPVVVVTEPKVNTAALAVDVAEGKTLYESSCVRCHKLYEPSDFTKEEWKPIVARMQKKARTDDAQTAKILAYLTHDLK